MRMVVLMFLGSPWSREAVIRLASCGHDVHVVDFSASHRESYLSSEDSFQAAEIQDFVRSIASFHRLEPRFSLIVQSLTAPRLLAQLLRKIDGEFLLTLYGGRFAVAAYLSGFRPYGVYLVGSDVLVGGGIKRELSRVALNAASVVFVNGKYLCEKARESAPRANIRSLYLGTDTEKFAPASPPVEPVRIICTRGFSEVYNNEYLIRALAKMPNLTQSYQLIFAAPGPLLKKVRALADEILPAEQRRSIEFLGGVDRNRMAEMLKSSHIFVSVSRSDGTSLSLMEGLACGLFPVLSDIPANREWVYENAHNGILVRLDDPKVLAGALIHAIENPELRVRARSYNRQLILDKADDRKNMAILSSELGEIVGAYNLKKKTPARSPD